MMRAAYPVLVVAAVLLSSAAGRGADLAVAVAHLAFEPYCLAEKFVHEGADR